MLVEVSYALLLTYYNIFLDLSRGGRLQMVSRWTDCHYQYASCCRHAEAVFLVLLGCFVQTLRTSQTSYAQLHHKSAEASR